MVALKPAAGFCVRVVVFYGLLAAPWPGVREAYAAVYRGAANAVFGSFGSGGLVHFQPLPQRQEALDSELTIRHRRSTVMATTRHSARVTGYLPTIEIVALILATPIPWSRRFKALLWGLLWVHVFVGVRITITLVYWFSADQPWALFHPSPFWRDVLARVFEVGAAGPSFSFVVPIFIWALVTLRRSDLYEIRSAG